MMKDYYNVLCWNLLVLLLGSFSASGCLLLLVFLASLNSPPLFPNAAQTLLSSNSKATAVSSVSVSIAAAVRRTMFEIGPKRSETLVGILCSSWHSKTLVGNHFEDFEL